MARTWFSRPEEPVFAVVRSWRDTEEWDRPPVPGGNTGADSSGRSHAGLQDGNWSLSKPPDRL